MTGGEQGQELRDLIHRAFDRHRSAATANPDFMTAAVLKNRLLDLTQRSFDERRFGFERFIDLIRSLDDVVAVDMSAKPPTVRLREAIGSSPGRGRLRHDLWQAVMDYSSGRQYVWDPALGVARRRAPDDPDDLPVMPTTTEEVLRGWREEFAAEQRPNSADDSGELMRWAGSGSGTRALPGDLRTAWNQTMQRKAVERLTSWFAERNLDPPSEMIVAAPAAGMDRAAVEDVEELRSFVVSVVGRMTPAELQHLALPASATLRVTKRRA